MKKRPKILAWLEGQIKKHFGRKERPERTEEYLMDAFHRLSSVAQATYIMGAGFIILVPMVTSGTLWVADTMTGDSKTLLWSLIWTVVCLLVLTAWNYITLYRTAHPLRAQPNEMTPSYNVMSAERYSMIELSTHWHWLMLAGYLIGCLAWSILIDFDNPGFYYHAMVVGGILGALVIPFVADRLILHRLGIINYTELTGNNYRYATVAGAPLHLLIGPGGKIRDISMFGVFDLGPDSFAEIVDQKKINVTTPGSDENASIYRFGCGLGVQAAVFSFKYSVDIFRIVGTLGYGDPDQAEPEYVQQIRLFLLEMVRLRAKDRAAVVYNEGKMVIKPETIDGFQLRVTPETVQTWIQDNAGSYTLRQGDSSGLVLEFHNVHARLFLGEIFVGHQTGSEISQTLENRKLVLTAEGNNASRDLTLTQSLEESTRIANLDPSVRVHALEQVGGSEASKASVEIMKTQILVNGITKGILEALGPLAAIFGHRPEAPKALPPHQEEE